MWGVLTLLSGKCFLLAAYDCCVLWSTSLHGFVVAGSRSRVFDLYSRCACALFAQAILFSVISYFMLGFDMTPGAMGFGFA